MINFKVTMYTVKLREGYNRYRGIKYKNCIMGQYENTFIECKGIQKLLRFDNIFEHLKELDCKAYIEFKVQ